MLSQIQELYIVFLFQKSAINQQSRESQRVSSAEYKRKVVFHFVNIGYWKFRESEKTEKKTHQGPDLFERLIDTI